MGRSTSRHDFEELRSRYQVVSHDELNNLTYLRDKRTRRHYMLKQLFANDEASVKHIEGELQRKKQLHHEHIAVLKEYYINLNEQFCSRMYSSGALYELPQRTLEDERNDRVHNHVPFDENQLWSIVASCILGFGYLQRNYVQHESVRASNLYVEESGTIKIADPFSKQLPTNYELYRQGRGTAGIYLSPAELRSYRQQHKFAVHNPYKSDVFSLALVLIELAFLQEQSDIYQRNRGTINQHILKERLDRVGRTYGEELRQILTVMTNFNESQRPDWSHLEGLVRWHDTASDSKRHLSQLEHPKHVRKGSSNNSSNVKPETAEFNPVERHFFMEQKVTQREGSEIHHKIQLSPHPHRHKRELAVINLDTPDHRSASEAETPAHIQNKTEIGVAKPPNPPRAVRVSEPPMRSGEENSFYGSGQQTPSRPPTQYIPKIVSVFQHHDQHFQQPFISTGSNTPQLNVTINHQPHQPLHPQKARTVNSFHLANSDHQHQAPNSQQYQKVEQLYYIPTTQRVFVQQQMSPAIQKNPPPSGVNQTIQSNNTSNSHSQRTKTEERHSHEFVVTSQHCTMKQPTVQVVKRTPVQHPTPKDVCSLSPVKGVQPFLIVDPSIPKNLQSEQKRRHGSQANSQVKSTSVMEKPQQKRPPPEPIPKRQPTQAISFKPMELSVLDKVCLREGLPHPYYELKTKADENLLDKNFSCDSHSFFSEQYQVEYSKKRAQSVAIGGKISLQMVIEETRKNRGSTPRSNIPPKVQSSQSAANIAKESDMGSQYKGSESRIPVSPPTVVIPPPTFYKKASVEPTDEIKFVKETYKHGSRYEGQKWKGMRHGKGRFYYDDGGMYDGNWNLNRMEGFGKLYYVNSELAYQGNWFSDHFEGHGKLYNEKPRNVSMYDYRSFDDIEEYWKTYEGEFKRDLKHGRGVLILQNGERYEGNFRQDQVHGEGIWKGKEGFVRGIWQQGQLVKVLN